MRPRRRRPKPEIQIERIRRAAQWALRLAELNTPPPKPLRPGTHAGRTRLFPDGHPRGGCWEEAALAGEFGADVQARTLAGDPCADFA